MSGPTGSGRARRVGAPNAAAAPTATALRAPVSTPAISTAIPPATPPTTAPTTARLAGFAPVVAPTTRLLILGSFPSTASLAAQGYYAHPRNQFWQVLGTLWGWPDLPTRPYAERIAALHAHGIGLWDVYTACERQGSLDAAIRRPELADVAGLAATLPALRGIAHHGGEAAKAMRHTAAIGLPLFRLPSTSPANAAWPLARKVAAWREVLAACGCARASDLKRRSR